MRRPRGTTPHLNIHLWITLLILFTAVIASAQSPRLMSIEPLQVDGKLGCRLSSTGLPSGKMLSSMRSGLISSMELNVEILNESDRVLARRRVIFRLSFDLWDEVYSVRVPQRSHVFEELGELRTWLNAPTPITLLPASLLENERGPFVLRAALILHPIAPRDRHRVENMIVGGSDRNEASVSVTQLIRFFYTDQKRREDPAGSVRSIDFQTEDLPHAVDPH